MQIAGRTEQTVFQKHVHQHTTQSFGARKEDSFTFVRNRIEHTRNYRLGDRIDQYVTQMRRRSSVKKSTNIEKPTSFTFVRNATIRKYSSNVALIGQSTFVRRLTSTTKRLYNISKDAYYTVSNTSASRFAAKLQVLQDNVNSQLQAMQAQINGLGGLSGASSRLQFQGQSAMTITGASEIVIASG